MDLYYTDEQQKLLIKYILQEYIKNIEEFGYHHLPTEVENPGS